MNKRKFFILVASLLVLAFAVQACATPAEAPAAEEPAAEEPVAEEPAAEEPAVEESAEPIEIRVLIAFTDKRLDFTREQATAFNEQFPQYNVVIEGLGSYNEVFEAAILSVEQGNPPSVIQFYEAATQEARDAVTANGNPLIKSVTDALGGQTEVNGVKVVLEDVVDAPKNYYSLDGKMESVPWNTSTTIMFTNMSIVEAAGVTDVPETWEEVDAACESIMALDDAPDGCIAWPNHSWLIEQTMAQQGALFANQDNGRDGRATEVYLSSEGATNYIQWWKDSYDKGYYLYTGVQRDWGGTTDLFNAQQVAMLLTSSSLATSVTDAGNEAGCLPSKVNGQI
ncbi:MAG: extracellular solute-binding protein [Anaerolineae bacterium]|nr:extracellular solute-binding protein [Anaerolineae bacterium]